MSTARTRPIWDAQSDFTERHFAPPADAADTDVLVIGAGVAGLVAALCLAREGRGVAVLDKQGLGEGESLRTTAHLASALDDRFHLLQRWHGRDGARLAAASHAAAIDWIEHFVQENGSGCGFRRVPGYLFPHDGEAGDERLRREADAAAEAGLPVEYLSRGLPGMSRMRPALRFARQARIDMDAYMRALAEAALARGVHFLRGEAREVEGGERPQARLADGAVLHAAAIVVATNVPFHERVPVHTKQAPYRTYVVAARVPANALPDALYWDDADPYHYVRLLDPRDGGEPWLIVGGEDHKTGQNEDPTAYVRLQAWTREMFPDVGQFTYAWSGQVIEPADGLAFIGADPGGEDNVYVATGDSGNGVTHGTLAGLLLCDMIMGRDNPWARLYDATRKTVRSPGEWLRENLNVAAQYTDWVKAGELRDPGELAPGEGAVIRRGAHRIAVYRTGEGGLRAFSARCPHMGCAVHWSPQEKSWNCPCHGSRFDSGTGAVLNGPATTPLAPWELESAEARRR